MSTAIDTWLAPLRPAIDPTGLVDWSRLAVLETEMNAALATLPIGPDLTAAQRSHRLLCVRQMLAARGHIDRLDDLFAQFICGYRDIDLRDTTGLGHGHLIARHASPECKQRWLPRLAAGALAGIAVTETHGGSRPVATRTYATCGPGGTWLITGRKTWISRLTEACVFVVFFRDPDGRLAAAAVDAAQPELHREPISPTGLAGWSWGVLDLDQVPVRPADVLLGDGMTLLRHHFAHYRPLVTATALGGAACVFDTITTSLTARRDSGGVPRLRDSALITIGRTHAQLSTALLGVVVASNLAARNDHNAEQWSAAMKAHGVDIANQVTAELALLLGASGFCAHSHIAKTRRDLNGLLYADGIHDSLYRTAGKHHTAESTVPRPRTPAPDDQVRRPDAPAHTAPSDPALPRPPQQPDDQPATA